MVCHPRLYLTIGFCQCQENFSSNAEILHAFRVGIGSQRLATYVSQEGVAKQFYHFRIVAKARVIAVHLYLSQPIDRAYAIEQVVVYNELTDVSEVVGDSVVQS